jgi:hypothetical protein
MEGDTPDDGATTIRRIESDDINTVDGDRLINILSFREEMTAQGVLLPVIKNYR